MTASNTTPGSGLHAAAIRLIEASAFQRGILTLIIINAVTLGLETVPEVMASVGTTIVLIDQCILAVFVVEISIRIYAYRGRFFRDPWSLFDTAVVAIALAPATGEFAVLRALRVLRVLRILTIVPSMRKVVGALLGSIPGLASIGLVLLLIFYVFAVITTNLFGQAYPEWFGSIGASLYTLFQVMTLESWSMGIARPVMETYPLAWALFVPFILIATFTMLNLFIAIIVNAMQSFAESSSHKSEWRAELESLRAEIGELKQLIRQSSTPRNGVSGSDPDRLEG